VTRRLAYDTEEANGRYGIRLWLLLTFETWRAVVVNGEAP
jgi:asparagine synthase (glutamine-hydrolysing)